MRRKVSNIVALAGIFIFAIIFDFAGLWIGKNFFKNDAAAYFLAAFFFVAGLVVGAIVVINTS